MKFIPEEKKSNMWMEMNNLQETNLVLGYDLLEKKKSNSKF